VVKEFWDYVSEFEKYLEPGFAITTKPEAPVAVVEKPEAPPILDEEEQAVVAEVEKLLQKARVEPPVKFDQGRFHAMVLAKVKPRYGVENPCTIAFTAADLGMATPCMSLAQAKGYWDYLVALYEIGFVHIWGYGYDEAWDRRHEAGCPTCTGEYAKCGGWWSLQAKAIYSGMPYYVALLYFEDVVEKRENLIKLAEQYDWQNIKRRLQRPMLHSVGSFAHLLLKKR